MKKTIVFIITVILCISLTGCQTYVDMLKDISSVYLQNTENKIDVDGEALNDEDDNIAIDNSNVADDSVQITMLHDSYFYTGNERPVRYVVADLEKLGFTNITTIEVEPGWFYFAVEDVKIYSASSDEMVYFDEGDTFPADALIEVYYYGGPMEDGMIQETNIFTIEQQLRSIEGYTWTGNCSVIEGRTGYFGDCYCEEKNVWVSLYGNDLEEITLARIDVFEDDYELLITFASFFNTSLIDAEKVQQWLREYDAENGDISKVFGDAEFSLHFGMENKDQYSLYITALE